MYRLLLVFFFFCSSPFLIKGEEGLPLKYWDAKKFINFGDHLSLKLVERIVGGEVRIPNHFKEKKLLAIGSILIFAKQNDVIWGTGMNGKRMDLSLYKFSNLDVRAVRGPLTRDFLQDNFNITCPEIYGDPALLMPYFFPELKRSENPKNEYIVIPHFSELDLYPKELYPNVVYPTEPWNVVVKKILNSKFVISSSLHGVVVAEAYGIPACYLRVTENEPLMKYVDYYNGTGRPNFSYATSIEEALKKGGQPPFICDLKKLYESFPFEYWPNAKFKHPNFDYFFSK